MSHIIQPLLIILKFKVYDNTIRKIVKNVLWTDEKKCQTKHSTHASYQLLSSEVQAHDLFGFFVFSAAAREDLAVTDLPVPEYSRVKFEVFCPTGKDWPKLGHATG